MSNPTDPTASSTADVNVTVRSEAAAVGAAGPTPLEAAAHALPSSVDEARDMAAGVLEAASTSSLPSNETLVSALESAKQSDVLQTLKDAPLSSTAKTALEHAEGLLGATQRLLEEKNQGDLAQQILAEGSAAAARVREAATVQEDIAATFGDERAKAAATAQDVMRRLFDITKLVVGHEDFRGLLRDVSHLASEWLQSVGLASVHAATGATDVAGDEMKRAQAQREELAINVARLAEAARDIMARLRDHPAWRDAAKEVVEVFSALRDRAADMAAREGAHLREGTVEDAEVRAHAAAAADKARALVENFGGSLEPLQTALDRVYDALLRKRPEVDTLLNEASEWLANADTIMDEERAQRLYNHTLTLVQEGTDDKSDTTTQIRKALADLASEGAHFIDSLRHDETAQNVQQHLSGLMQALFLDEKTGEAKFKPELLDDLRRLVPVLVRSLATLPVARIDVTTDEVDVILDNLTLAATILPKDIGITTETHVSGDTGNVVSTIKLLLRNLQVAAPDLVFYYYKKDFPSLVDVGIADVHIPGRGLDIDLTLQPSLEPNKLLKVLDTKTIVHELDLDVKKARHNWLYTILSPYVRRVLSTRIEAAVTDALRTAIENLDRAVESAVQTTNAAGGVTAAIQATAVGKAVAGAVESVTSMTAGQRSEE